ncbi:MAG: response regulator [Methanomicrobiales archaeon]|nr:response regulator [Methanomicrobiales archaeon]
MADKKILIVEDNAIIAMETIERLKRLGYLISGVAATGHDAISLAASARPDLVLMDINLKGDMDGIEAAQEIVSAHPIPVIYLTAYSDEETLKRAMASRPIKYLVKPYRERDLYTSIEEAFRNQPGPPVPEIPAMARRFIDCITDCGDAIFVAGQDGRIIFQNQKAGLLTGLTLDEIRGRILTEVVSVSAPDPEKKKGLSGARGVQTPPCTLQSAGGKTIPGCAAWIGGGREPHVPGVAFMVFWEKDGDGP